MPTHCRSPVRRLLTVAFSLVAASTACARDRAVPAEREVASSTQRDRGASPRGAARPRARSHLERTKTEVTTAVIEEGKEQVLRVTGARLRIPSGALRPGTEVVLKASPVNVEEIQKDLGGLVVVSAAFGVRGSAEQTSRGLMSLELEASNVPRPGMVAVGSEATDRRGWTLDLAEYDREAGVVRLPLFGVAKDFTTWVLLADPEAVANE